MDMDDICMYYNNLYSNKRLIRLSGLEEEKHKKNQSGIRTLRNPRLFDIIAGQGHPYQTDDRRHHEKERQREGGEGHSQVQGLC